MADNVLSFIFRVVNQATAPLGQVAHSLSGVATQMQQFGERASLAMMGFQGMITIGQSIKDNLSDPIRNLGSSLIDTAAKAETMETTLRGLIGDAAESKKVFETLEDFSQRFGYSEVETFEAARTLVIAGIKSGQDIKQVFNMVGDAAAALNIPLATLSGQYVRYFQMLDAGIPVARSLRQINMEGIPIYEMLAKAMGVGVDQVKKLAEEGRISTGQFELAFLKASEAGGRFYEQAKNRSQTLEGLKKRFDETVHALKVGIGQAIIDALGTKEAWERKIKLVKEFSEKLMEFVKAHPVIIKVVVVLGALLAILGPLIIAFGTLAGVIAIVGIVTMPVIGTILLVIAAFAAIVIAIIWLRKHWDNLWESFMKLSTTGKAVAVAIGLMAAPFLILGYAIYQAAMGIKNLVGWCMDLYNIIKTGLIGGIQELISWWDTLSEKTQFVFTVIGKTIAAPFIGVFEVIKNIINLWDYVKSKIPNVLLSKLGFEINTENVGSPAKTTSEMSKLKGESTLDLNITMDKDFNFSLSDFAQKAAKGSIPPLIKKVEFDGGNSQTLEGLATSLMGK